MKPAHSPYSVARICPSEGIHKLLTLVTLLLVISPVLAQTTMEVIGMDTLILDNNKSIHHEVNLYSKNLLRQAAIYDAIGKGADIRVTRKVFSSTDDTGEQHFQKYFERVLEQYNITWKLISEEFKPLTKKRWVCIVRGVVTSEKPENIDFGVDTDVSEFRETYIISDKRFNKVTVNTEFNVGTRLGVYKTIQRKTVTGYTTKEVVKGLLVVDYQGDQYSEARIVRGLYRVHEKSEVKPLDYNTNRKGFGYEYNADAAPASTDPSLYGKNFISHAVLFYLQSYITRFGGVLGYEVIQCYNVNPGKIQYLNVGYLGLDYNIGILPGFLYLRPGFNIGYIFDNDILKDPYWGQPRGRWDSNVVLNPRLMAVLRFQKLELYGGISYKYVNDLPTLTNSFTTLGLRINLAKY